MKTLTREKQQSLTPDDALILLKEGNKRFVSNLTVDRDHLQQVNETRDGQYPFAAILSCIDSRVPAEFIFDQGFGDIFSIRIAGNFINDDILGSMEFACKIAGSKLIVVLGHTRCGAIQGVCDGVELGHLTQMLAKMKPAVEKVKESGLRISSNTSFVNKVVHQNVEYALKEIDQRSVVLNQLVQEGKIKIVGAIYDIETGKVNFLNS